MNSKPKGQQIYNQNNTCCASNGTHIHQKLFKIKQDQRNAVGLFVYKTFVCATLSKKGCVTLLSWCIAVECKHQPFEKKQHIVSVKPSSGRKVACDSMTEGAIGIHATHCAKLTLSAQT